MSKKEQKLIENQKLEPKEVYQPHDKMFRKILLNKTQAVGLLNHFFNFENKLKEEDIERYNCRFINTQFRNRETDILYKVKGTHTFFLIEHQTRVDYNMAQRIAEYQNEIIRIENPIISNSKDIVVPLIIPLVIYASSGSIWDAYKNIPDAQPNLEGYKKLGLGGYDVLDINMLKNDELMKHSLFIYRFLSIEKAKTTEELASTLAYLLANEKNEIYRDFLKDIIQYIYKETLKCDEIYKYFNEGNLKGEDSMSVIEMVLKEKNDLLTQGRLEGKNEGKKEGIVQGKKAGIKEVTEKITIEMIKRNLDDSFIMQITKIDAQTLEKIKKKHKFKK